MARARAKAAGDGGPGAWKIEKRLLFIDPPPMGTRGGSDVYIYCHTLLTQKRLFNTVKRFSTKKPIYKEIDMADKIHDLILKQRKENEEIQQMLQGKQNKLNDMMHDGAKEETKKVRNKLLPRFAAHFRGGQVNGSLHSIFCEIGEALETISKLDVNYRKEMGSKAPYGLEDLDAELRYFFNHLFTGVWTFDVALVDVLEKMAVQKRIPGNPFHVDIKAVKNAKK